MEGLELASKVSTKSIYNVGDPAAPHKISVMDFGTKRNILNSLASRNCYLTIFPAKTPIEEISKVPADGYFLSNGPGDPASMDYAIDTTKALIQSKKPIFGICLGHQILALANGIKTYKMHNGHRGANQPVINLLTGLCEVTSQNHGFSVSTEDIESRQDIIEVTHKNLNDGTIEGIRMKNQDAFSVQYHPEANPGPHDSKYLFDHFVNLISQSKNN
jgi:carbamoyl-phosphate synthase small subunit